MDFEASPEIRDITARMREFVESQLYPLESQLLAEGFGAVLPALRDKRRQVKALGLWAPNAPREYGGMGLNLVDHGLVLEAVGRSLLGLYTFGCQAPDAGNIELLLRYGTPEQQARWLPGLIDGELRSCFGMTEPDNSGANPIFLEARADRDGGDYVLNGRKWFTTGADGASLCIAMVVTDPQAADHERASMILVPTDNPGFVHVKNTPVMGHAGQDWLSHAEIRFENCRVPRANLLGEEGQGFRLAQARLGPGRIHHCMRWIGICARTLDIMTTRAAGRVVGHGDKRLGDSDIIRAWIAECAAEIHAARLMTLHAAWRIDRVGAKEARNEIAMIKYFVAGVMQKVVDRAIQVHGGLGMTDYTILNLFYREERAARIYDGPDEVHKISLARRLLRAAGR